MNKQVFLTLQTGNFKQGFPVVLRIQEEVAGTLRDIYHDAGMLPPSTDNIEESFRQWQADFHNRVNKSRETVESQNPPRGKPGTVIHYSSTQSAQQLATQLNDWLNSGNTEAWQKIRDGLQQNLNKTDDIRVLIQTEDTLLRQLPWQVWDLFAESYPNSEIALSTTAAQLPNTFAKKYAKVRILAVLGKSNEINMKSCVASCVESLVPILTRFTVCAGRAY